MLPPPALSRAVVGRAAKVAPYPLLGENTLVISDALCLARTRRGATALMFRVGDTYPSQTIEVCVKAYIYRWRPGGSNSTRSTTTATATFTPGEPDDFEVLPLDVGYGDGSDRPLLWLPIVYKHVITPTSPLSHWLTPAGRLRDADASIAVSVEGYRYCTSSNVVRSRVFSVARDVREGHSFVSIVAPPSETPDLKPRVNWAAFHDTVRVVGAEPGPPPPPPASPPQPRPPSLTEPRPPNLHRNSMEMLRADAAALGRESAAHALADNGGGASTPAAPSSTATGGVTHTGLRRGRGPLIMTAPPEGAGGMLLPPGLDPQSTFRVRAAAARARLDAALFEEGAAANRERRRGDGGV